MKNHRETETNGSCLTYYENFNECRDDSEY